MTSKKLDDTGLITFKAITDFTTDLEKVFGKDQASLRLYSRLIEHTRLLHVEPILKHIEAFKEFCVDNREAIIEKSDSDLVNTKIRYSEKVFINMESLFRLADKSTKEVMWSHLLTISALTDPSSQAKKVLSDSIKQKQARGGTGSEEKFLSSIIDKVEQHVDPETITNPMQAVTQIMTSGVFTDLIGNMNEGLQSGDLDLGRLMGAVQGMVGSMGGMGGMGGMMGGMGESSDATGASEMGGMPDMGAMFGNLASMMGGMDMGSMGNMGNMGNMGPPPATVSEKKVEEIEE